MTDTELEYALKNWDNLSKEEQDYYNKLQYISHKKYVRKQRIKNFLLWLKANGIALAALIVAIITFIFK